MEKILEWRKWKFSAEINQKDFKVPAPNRKKVREIWASTDEELILDEKYADKYVFTFQGRSSWCTAT